VQSRKWFVALTIERPSKEGILVNARRGSTRICNSRCETAHVSPVSASFFT
jgi:hypothetical protein